MNLYLVDYFDDIHGDQQAIVAAETPEAAFHIWRASRFERTVDFDSAGEARVWLMPPVPGREGVMAWLHNRSPSFPLNMPMKLTDEVYRAMHGRGELLIGENEMALDSEPA